MIKIHKMDAPLGATIRNRDDSIVIGRIVKGGAAEYLNPHFIFKIVDFYKLFKNV